MTGGIIRAVVARAGDVRRDLTSFAAGALRAMEDAGKGLYYDDDKGELCYVGPAPAPLQALSARLGLLVESPSGGARELRVIAAANAYRDADAALRAHTAGRRDATEAPSREWRAERVRLTDDVVRARIALQRTALEA